MGVLHGMVIVKGKGAVLWVNLEHPIVTNGHGVALFPNYFGKDLFTELTVLNNTGMQILQIRYV